jgi:hypothetical protein
MATLEDIAAKIERKIDERNNREANVKKIIVDMTKATTELDRVLKAGLKALQVQGEFRGKPYCNITDRPATLKASEGATESYFSVLSYELVLGDDIFRLDPSFKQDSSLITYGTTGAQVFIQCIGRPLRLSYVANGYAKDLKDSQDVLEFVNALLNQR